MKFAVEAILRSAVFTWCIGVFIYLRGGSTLGSLLFLNYGWTHAASAKLEHTVAWIILAASISVLIYPLRAVLVSLSAFALFYAWTAVDQGGAAFSQWAIPAAALRITTPLIFAAWLSMSPEQRGKSSSGILPQVFLWLMILATAVTFITHGLEAWHLHPQFIDMTLGFCRNILHYPLTETQAGWILRAVGIIDIAVAILLIISRHPALLLWMIFWGLFTSFLRIFELGLVAYPEVLLRTVHIAIPLVLYINIKNQHSTITNHQ